MTTLVRLLQLVRRLNSLPKIAITSQNSLKNAAFQRLLHSQALFSTKQQKESTNASEAQENQEVNEDRKMIILFQHEMQKYGRLYTIDVSKLLDDVKELGDSGVVSNLQGLFLLQCCSELMSNKSTLTRKVLAYEIWKTLKELNVQLDVSHYNALLNVYAETDHQYVPLEFLKEMIDANIKPNRVTYQKLIAYYCNHGQVSEASHMLEIVKNEGISVTEEMMSSLAYGHFLSDNDDAAIEILEDMKQLGLYQTITTYSTLMYVYASRGEVDNIRKTIEDCELKSIWIPDRVFLRIAYNLSLNGFPEQVDEFLALTSRGNTYLREATKIIYKLIENHHYETAFKIYQTLPENRTIIGGNTFLQALINTNAPLEKSIEYCRLMENEKLNPVAFLSAVRRSIASDMYESTINLLQAWKHLGGEIKEKYFLPILKAYGEGGQHDEFINVLDKIITDFKIQPSLHMLTSYIVPYMRCDDDEMLPLLLSYQINALRASNAVLLHLLQRNEIRKAVNLMCDFAMEYRPEILRSTLLKALKNTEDVPSFVSIVHHLYMLKLNVNRTAVNKNKKSEAREFTDSIISETVDMILLKNDLTGTTHLTTAKYLIIALFRNLIDKGINLSPETVEEIKAKLRNEMTPQIEEALLTLQYRYLIPKPIRSELHNLSLKKKLTNIEKLESVAKILSVKHQKEASFYKKKLVHYYCNILDYKKVYDMMEDIERNRIEIPSSLYATVIDAHLRMNKIEEAEVWLMKARGMIPDFHISKIILLKLVIAIAEQGHFERALECLKQPTFPSNARLLVTCTKFLTAVMKFNDENYLLQAFDVLQENGYIKELENHLFNPIVLLYLERGDSKAALEKFEWVHKLYGFAPCQIQLMKTFIETEDTTSLNRVKNISEKVDGALACYFHLALAHLENSQPDKAKRVIEKHVPHLPENIVFERAVYYYNNAQIDNLEGLFEILNDLNYDVERLCIILLKAFGYYNEWEKGYKLWTRMQEENIKPSNTFFDYLNLVVSKKGSASSILQEFFEAAEKVDDLKTRELLEQLPMLYKSDGYSRLCKKCCQRENFSDVIELCKDLRKRYNLDIHSFDAELILNTMVQQKDVASVEKIGLYMSQKLKNQIIYNSYLNRAYLISGSWNLYLNNIEKKLEDENVRWSNLNVHVKTAIESLFQHPELLEQYESIAYKSNDKNIPGLLHILWIYYFFTDSTKADTLWERHIKNSRVPTWLDVRNNQRISPEMYIKIAELLKDSAVNDSVKMNAFNSLIDRALKSDHPKKYDIGLKCLLSATQKFPMNSFNMNLLANLQSGLENSGVEWPWSWRYNNVDKRKVRNVIKAIMDLSK